MTMFSSRPQHNLTNPILVEFRERATHARQSRDDLIDSFLDWLDHADETHTACREMGVNNAHIDHARRVLARYSKMED